MAALTVSNCCCSFDAWPFNADRMSIGPPATIYQMKSSKHEVLTFGTIAPGSNTKRLSPSPPMARGSGAMLLRRGIGTTLAWPAKIFQMILRHANVSTSVAYYSKPDKERGTRGLLKLNKTVREEYGTKAQSGRP